MNKYQEVIKEAMDDADKLTYTSGRFRPAAINTSVTGVNGMQRYLVSSPKWNEWARGWMTFDRKWVITRSGSSFLIGRNY
jgi:hypothetical protein